MEIIKRSLRRDVIVITPDEMDDVSWDEVRSGCIYLDIWGKVHIELGHKGFINGPHNTNPWHFFVEQEKMYEELPFRMLAACKAKPLRDLVGARQFMYLRKRRVLLDTNIGILPWGYMKERGDEQRSGNVGIVRRHAFEMLFQMLDDVAQCLGARYGYFTVATIPQEKMERYGCVPLSSKSFWRRVARTLSTFPIRGIKAYVKIYKTE
jgi:hypothetical protein